MARILALSKRQYMRHDLLDDRYGRFREIPLELARMGHVVQGICLSYQSRPEGLTVDSSDGGVEVLWRSVNLGRTIVTGSIAHRRLVNEVANEFKPEVILASSDVFHVIRGVSLARAIGAISVVDLSDNYESYRGGSLPGVVSRFRHAVKDASIVLCVSSPLARFVRDRYQRSKPTLVIEMGVLTDRFRPGSQQVSRVRLGLPTHLRLVGVAGALLRHRNIEVLFRAMDLVHSEASPTGLVAAGPRDTHLAWPEQSPLFDLGVLDHAAIPDLICSSDVMAVPIQPSDFGQFCFPQKASEAIACGVPIVAARLPAMEEYLGGDPRMLFEPDDPVDMARALKATLAEAPATLPSVFSWRELAIRISDAIDTKLSINTTDRGSQS